MSSSSRPKPNSLYAENFARQQEFFDNLNSYAAAAPTYYTSYAPSYSPYYSGGVGSRFGGSGFQGASAGAGIGPGGSYQTASVYPGVGVS